MTPIITARPTLYRSIRLLHTSPPKATDLYARLGVKRDASAAEIKRSFYALSKTHHPDVNPSPTASSSFSLLADAYAILSDPPRRAAYDATLPAAFPPPPRRRPPGPFRGPAPSFYRNGGWGIHASVRRRAHQESTGFAARVRASRRGRGDDGDGGKGGRKQPGMGPGQEPLSERAGNLNFDWEGHARTHKREDHRRWERMRRAVDEDGTEFEPQLSLAGNFCVLAAILGVALGGPFVYLYVLRYKRRRRDLD
ncbi:Heat shock protein DnaJ [Ophiocordyceps camponoti-floridani]|uniref:Heat shock protein DnaJ n=1 Tax=Ophiocordyceps camponoti-floridani TaxID=2030778 RepID=A0A8H4QCT7_9HYPO|nr:Heat shock protein DnaJ [Ophiocordyceps camponoti-floridani]